MTANYVDGNLARESKNIKYYPVNNEELYISSKNNSHEDDPCEDYVEVVDGPVGLKMDASLMALVNKEDRANNHEDIENQQQQYTTLTNKMSDNESKEPSENVPDEWVTLGASYYYFHKLLLLIYSGFIVLTIYNTVDVARK